MKSFIHFIKLCFLYLYQALFYLLDNLIRSKKKQVSVYITDKNFGDNLAYFYAFLADKKDLNVRLITQDKKLFLFLKNKEQTPLYVRSITGLWFYFRSQVIIIQNGDAKLFFFPLLLNPKTKFILNLWHGIPLKRLNRQVKTYQNNRSSFQYQKFNALLVCSEFERLLMATCFFMDIDDIWITGTPRNDEMFTDNNYLKEYSDKKNILYAPTWREYGNKTSFFPFDDYDENKLIDFLKENDVYLFLRGHRLEMNLLQEKYNSLIDKCDHIILADQNKFPNIPELLKISRGLITDYSSIYLDYLLLNRPIIFTPYDLNEYQSYRGFLFDYYTHTPGPKVSTQDDFLKSLKEISLSTNQHQKERIQLQKKMHRYQDSGAKKRIFDKLAHTLNWL